MKERNKSICYMDRFEKVSHLKTSREALNYSAFGNVFNELLVDHLKRHDMQDYRAYKLIKFTYM